MVLFPAITFSPEENPSEILVDTVPASFELNTYWGVFPDGNNGIGVISVSTGWLLSIDDTSFKLESEVSIVNVLKLNVDEFPSVSVTVILSPE